MPADNNFLEPLSQELLSRARIIGNDACWRLADIEATLDFLRDHDQYILGLERFEFTRWPGNPMVSAVSGYASGLTVAEYHQLALADVRSGKFVPDDWVNVTWASGEWLASLRGRSHPESP